MIKSRDCPVCGGPIMFSYERPNLDFYIEDGKIVRDTNRDLWYGKDPYLAFYCTNDITHNLEGPMLVDSSSSAQSDWETAIEEEFYEKIFPDL
jgi:hypothetical protein